MKQLLVTVLAVIMSVSLASAAPGSVKEAAREKMTKALSETKEVKEEAVKKLASQLSAEGTIKSEKIVEGIKKIFPKTEDQLNALSLFTAAKEGSTEQKSLSVQLNYALELLGAGKLNADSLNPLFNAAKILLESDGVEAESVAKLRNQIKRKTSTTYFATQPNSKLKLTEEEIDMLSFVNELYQGADKKSSINDVKDITEAMKEEYRKWKENCKG